MKAKKVYEFVNPREKAKGIKGLNAGKEYREEKFYTDLLNSEIKELKSFDNDDLENNIFPNLIKKYCELHKHRHCEELRKLKLDTSAYKLADKKYTKKYFILLGYHEVVTTKDRKKYKFAFRDIYTNRMDFDIDIQIYENYTISYDIDADGGQGRAVHYTGQHSYNGLIVGAFDDIINFFNKIV